MTPRIIAFYLPQFHPIPENDVWWGKGFTEWTNVARAKPLFQGHYQPHVPADLGFYDLRMCETRSAQAELAREYGIEGFCYWHYWFEGKRLLERPFDEVLTSGEPDFQFCLAWANESWSRRWLGEEKEILQKQTYSEEDDIHHIRWLIKAFADRRYLRVNGRPLLLVYRPADLPDPKRTTDVWREGCSRHGLAEPYLLGVNAHCAFLDCRTLGFDGTLNFEPQLGALPEFMNDAPSLFKFRRNRMLGVRSLTLMVALFKSEQKLLTWVSTKPFDLTPWPGRAAFDRAMAARASQDYAAAERYLTAAIDVSPEMPSYYYWRGDTRTYLSLYDAAIDDFTRSITLMPDDRASYLGRGIAALWNGEPEAALSDLTFALDHGTQTDRVSVFAYRVRGTAHAALKQPALAVSDYQAYLALLPSAPDRAEVEAWIADLS